MKSKTKQPALGTKRKTKTHALDQWMTLIYPSMQRSSLLKNSNQASSSTSITATLSGFDRVNVKLPSPLHQKLHFRNCKLPAPILTGIQFPQRKPIGISGRQALHSIPQQTPFPISISSHLLKCAPSQDFIDSLGFTNFRVSPFLDYSTSRTPHKWQQPFY